MHLQWWRNLSFMHLSIMQNPIRHYPAAINFIFNHIIWTANNHVAAVNGHPQASASCSTILPSAADGTCSVALQASISPASVTDLVESKQRRVSEQEQEQSVRQQQLQLKQEDEQGSVRPDSPAVGSCRRSRRSTGRPDYGPQLRPKGPKAKARAAPRRLTPVSSSVSSPDPNATLGPEFQIPRRRRSTRVMLSRLMRSPDGLLGQALTQQPVPQAAPAPQSSGSVKQCPEDQPAHVTPEVLHRTEDMHDQSLGAVEAASRVQAAARRSLPHPQARFGLLPSFWSPSRLGHSNPMTEFYVAVVHMAHCAQYGCSPAMVVS